MNTSQDLTDEARDLSESRDRTMQNLPWIFSGLIFLFVCIKILLASRLDTSTALGIARATNPLDPLPGILITFIPAASVGVGTIAVYMVNNVSGAISIFRHWLVYFALVGLLSVVQDWKSTLFQLAIPLLFGASWLIGKLAQHNAAKHGITLAGDSMFAKTAQLTGYPKATDRVLVELIDEIKAVDERLDAEEDSSERRKLRNKRSSLIERYDSRLRSIDSAHARPIEYVAVTVVGILVFSSSATLFTTDPWIPVEQVTLSNKTTLVGYVVGSGDKWTDILQESDRQIKTIKSDDIASRTVCLVEKSGDTKRNVRTIWGVRLNKANYPVCRKQ
ncbi:hypothetical protein [Actinomadura rudentiformis]|uniref:Uncharacterized protein n=1 Tax=Actinomadura rudentiformis TaxID=359158 RepID=A0A6H9YD60_9ACTN|nr:hypothetical protein [Actinomadura rudentiformis]KAB2341527.1 hypothetical protein F8566_41010 [Actinomadura rudentiformis]